MANHFYSFQGKLKTLLNECSAFPGNTCHLRNGIPARFPGKFSQLPMKTYSGCFYLGYISRLIFPSLGISSPNSGLFNSRPLLGKQSCCPAGNGTLAPTKPLRNGAQWKRLPLQHHIWRSYKQILEGQCLCFYTACQRFGEACLSPKILRKQRRHRKSGSLLISHQAAKSLWNAIRRSGGLEPEVHLRL